MQRLTHWKRSWCWERWKAGGEGGNREWYGWMASLTQWTWLWESSGSWWWTGNPVVLQSMGRKESDTTEWLNWTEFEQQREKKMENSNSFRDLWAHNKRGNIHITLSLSHQDQCRSGEYFHYSFFFFHRTTMSSHCSKARRRNWRILSYKAWNWRNEAILTWQKLIFSSSFILCIDFSPN